MTVLPLILAIIFIGIYMGISRKFKNKLNAQVISAGYCFSMGIGLFVFWFWVESPYREKIVHRIPANGAVIELTRVPPFELILILLILSIVAIIAGMGILKGKNWGRILFMISCPFVIFLYSYAIDLPWEGPDVPLDNYSLGMSYIAIVYILSRSKILYSLGVDNPSSLRSRVTIPLFLFTLIMLFISYIMIYQVRHPMEPGESLLDHQLRLEELASFEVAFHSVTWAYVLAVIACSIPSRR